MWRCRYRVLPWSCSRDFLGGLRLRGAVRRLRERADHGPARQIDLEIVVTKTFGIAQHDGGGLRKRCLVGGLAAKCRFGLSFAPGLVSDTAEGEPHLLDGAALEFQA